MKQIPQKLGTLLTLTIYAGFLCGAAEGPTWQVALQDLKNGNQRFSSGQASHCSLDDTTLALHQEGQAPEAVILSCSDSRVPAERIFDQDIGGLFTIRVAGNVLNDDIIASIEYAVAHLGSRLIVVMGHESCGAVKAALDQHTEEDSPSLNRLIAEITRNLGNLTFPSSSSDPTLRGAVRKNVSSVATELALRSKIIGDAIQSGKVNIVQAIYSLNSGKVEFLS